MSPISAKLLRFRPRLSLTGATLGAMLLATSLGCIAYTTKNPWLLSLSEWLKPCVELWTKALELIILPLACSYLFVAIASPRQIHHPGRAIALTLLLLSGMLLTATLVTVVLAPQCFEFFLRDVQGLGLGASPSLDLPQDQVPGPIGFGEWIAGLIPSDLTTLFSRGQLLSALLVTLMFGFAAIHLRIEQRVMVSSFAQCLADMAMTLVHWLLLFLPVVVFAVMFSLFTASGLQLIGPLGWYLSAVVLLLFGFTLACYPLAYVSLGISPRQFAHAAFPVQVIALGTRSSMVCMQPVFDASTQALKVPVPVAELLVPLAVSLFRLSTAISTPFKLLFLIFIYGSEIETLSIISFLLANFIISFGTPGIPTRIVGVKFPLYLSLGIPAEGVILLGAIDAIPDMFKTLLNVTSSLLAVAILTRWIGPAESESEGQEADTSGPMTD